MHREARPIKGFTVRTIKAALSILLVTAGAWAQSVATSQISGTVQDQSGAAVAGADVRVTQIDTGLRRRVPSGPDGAYVITSLPSGPYEMQVSKEGFNSFVQKGIVLQVNSNPAINPVLAVGSVSSEVVVEAGATMVETQSSGIGQVIDNQRVLELPLNGRQATSLILLAGGATTAPAGDLNTNKNYPTVTISVSGGLPTA